MKKISILYLILALSLGFIKPALAQESPFGANQQTNTPDLNQIQFLESVQQVQTADNTPVAPIQDPIIVNTLNYSLTKEQVESGQRFKVFDDKFVFQLDEGMLSSAGNLRLREIILPPDSKMAPPDGFQLASRIYEYDWRAQAPEIKAKALWFSIKYDSADYFRKNIYYFDELKNKWIGLPGIISNWYSKIITTFPLPYAKVAILEDIDIMTEGYASWYRFKGCNCAASPDYPKGTKLKVTNLKNDTSVVVTINDWGPDRSVHPDRVIDLDVVAFKQIASTYAGLCQVKVELVGQAIAANN